mmetsp:Transcript_18458/g.28945  ORF Transcript_18458/g.28945 Transcript_18458/m.28945 type:complete len:319 (+) Transcript_18458:2-958(+)
MISFLFDDPPEQSAIDSASISHQNRADDNDPDKSSASEDINGPDAHWWEPPVPDGYRHVHSDDKNYKSMLIPALVSLLTIAAVSGMVFIVLAYRKKILAEYSAKMMTVIDDEVSFDEGSWNGGEGGERGPPDDVHNDHYNAADQRHTNGIDDEPSFRKGSWNGEDGGEGGPPDDAYDYYNDAEQRHANGIADNYYYDDAEQYYAQCSYATGGANIIDPPDSLVDGYESKQHATDSSYGATPNLSQNGDGAERIEADYSENTDPRIFVEENQAGNSNNIDEILEETRADDFNPPFDNNVYSILDEIEEEMRKAREITKI